MPGYCPLIATKKRMAGIIAIGPVSPPAHSASLRRRMCRVAKSIAGMSESWSTPYRNPDSAQPSRTSPDASAAPMLPPKRLIDQAKKTM